VSPAATTAPGTTPSEADFGNWIRRARVVGLAAAAMCFALLAAAGWVVSPWVAVAPATLALVFGAITLHLVRLAHHFSDKGGGLQRRLWNITLDGLDWDGDGLALDVGTGNGAVAILLAEKHPTCRVIGLDTWAPAWGYSQAACEENAVRRGVDDRVGFRPSSAAELPFGDGEADAVVSHFVFHEVADAPSAEAVVLEALRVLRPGGAFSFHDMFDDVEVYGARSDFLARIRDAVGDDVEMTSLRDLIDLPSGTAGRRALGNAARLSGRKAAVDPAGA